MNSEVKIIEIEAQTTIDAKRKASKLLNQIPDKFQFFRYEGDVYKRMNTIEANGFVIHGIWYKIHEKI